MMTTAEKLTVLRRAMAQRGLAAYLVPTDDFHASEYVGDYFKAREYLSGFTGASSPTGKPNPGPWRARTGNVCDRFHAFR